MNDAPGDALTQALRRLREAGGDGRSLDHESLAVIRRAAIARMRAGERPAGLASEYGLTRGTLYYWRSLAEEGHPRASQAAPGGRTPYKVSPQAREQLRQAVLGDPRAVGLTRPLWNRGLVRWYLREHLNTDISANHVRLLLQQLQLWPATNPPAYAQQCALVPWWVETEFGAIRTRAETSGAPLYFLQVTAVEAGAELRLMSLVQTKGAARDFALLPAEAEGGLEQACGRFLDRVLDLHSGPVVLIGDPLIAPTMRAMAAAAAARSRISLMHLPAPHEHEHRAVLHRASLEEQQLERARLRAAVDAAAAAVTQPQLTPEQGDDLGNATVRPAADGHAAPSPPHQHLLDDLVKDVRRRHQAQRLAAHYAHLQTLAEAAQTRSKHDLGQLRRELNQLLRAGRELDLGAPELAAATGLTRNTVNLVLRRTPPPEHAPATPAQALAKVGEAARLWRQAEESHSQDRQLSALLAEHKSKATAAERQACADRDQAIRACAQGGVAVSVIAAAAGVSDSLIYALTADGDLPEYPGAAAEMRQLAISLARWREARHQAESARQRLAEHDMVRRQASEDEHVLQQRRNILIARCVASGYTVGEIATWAELDVATVTGSLSAPVAEVSPEDGRQALDDLIEVSRSWRNARQEAAEQRAWAEQLDAERRRCLDQEEAARRQRNRALLACRRKGVSIGALATRLRVDTRMVREALQAAEAAEDEAAGLEELLAVSA
ncbi:hypothetical protein [Nonomuraea dietziae]|uniref:Transposase n=1 Tax=Nonomuraea dietziae TaxID=65515 RepID=A0A7W5VKM4_9ACTN|nr:hypothetical protein [Nonomuraea dietziae]MBB3733828.1 transposase [Nonomuraea dietziae]